jgi:hypothetical protein
MSDCYRSLTVAAVLITALTHVVFFGEDRYHLFLSPLLCILAAAALRASERVANVATLS